jgi:hypothetical protein
MIQLSDDFVTGVPQMKKTNVSAVGLLFLIIYIYTYHHLNLAIKLGEKNCGKSSSTSRKMDI